MKKTLLAVTLAALTSGAATTALAADPKAPEPDFSISGNFGLFSDYRFRGMSQTKKTGALQGGFDLTHKTGAYLGTWASNVSGFANTNGNGQEVDVYGGYKFALGPLGLDVGYLAYIYPGNAPTSNIKQGTREFYLGVGYGPVSYKVSRTTGNWFGACNGSSGSVYHDLTLSHSITEKISLSAHAGKQDVKCTDNLDYSDYRLGMSYDLGNALSLGLSYVTTTGLSTAGKNFFTQNGNGTGTKLHDSGAVLSLSKTF